MDAPWLPSVSTTTMKIVHSNSGARRARLASRRIRRRHHASIACYHSTESASANPALQFVTHQLRAHRKFNLTFAPQIHEFNSKRAVKLKVLDWRPTLGGADHRLGSNLGRE